METSLAATTQGAPPLGTPPTVVFGTEPTKPDSKPATALLPFPFPFRLLPLLRPPWSSAQALKERHTAMAAIVVQFVTRILNPPWGSAPNWPVWRGEILLR